MSWPTRLVKVFVFFSQEQNIFFGQADWVPTGQRRQRAVMLSHLSLADCAVEAVAEPFDPKIL